MKAKLIFAGTLVVIGVALLLGTSGGRWFLGQIFFPNH